MAHNSGGSTIYGELSGLFFETRQIIRQSLPGTKQSDPNAWLRLQTIRFIETADKPTMHDVAAYLRVKAPSATSLVSHLVSQGLIARRTGLDRREVILSVTPAGKKALKAYGEQSEKMMRNTFSTLDESEVGSLCSLLKKLVRSHKRGI
ncbi:MAG: winged helix-turn-helix transcriptional regulator [Candidatus Pacebacteria bacterium]|nr:winged helix-turn-helix transcriptional regulator [Candidatus Paceibacterota bacterium]